MRTNSFWRTNAVWVIALIGVAAFAIILYSVLMPDNLPEVAPVKQGPDTAVINPGSTKEQDKIASVHGYWYDAQGNYLVITQNDANLEIHSYTSLGQVEGQGTGVIDGKDLTLNVATVIDGPITLKGTLSDSKNTIKGKMTVNRGGTEVTTRVEFIREEKRD